MRKLWFFYMFLQLFLSASHIFAQENNKLQNLDWLEKKAQAFDELQLPGDIVIEVNYLKDIIQRTRMVRYREDLTWENRLLNLGISQVLLIEKLIELNAIKRDNLELEDILFNLEQQLDSLKSSLEQIIIQIRGITGEQSIN